MKQNTPPIKSVDLSRTDASSFTRHCASCLVLTADGQILLQQRPKYWGTFAGCLSVFGGGIEAGETPMQGLIRELKEELGADVRESDVVPLGIYTEAVTGYTELIYGYFWHDKHHTITGCYECEAVAYNTPADALAQPNLMDEVKWLLQECTNHHLLNPNESAGHD